MRTNLYLIAMSLVFLALTPGRAELRGNALCAPVAQGFIESYEEEMTVE